MDNASSILIENIYYMLSYAFAELRKDEYKKIGSERFDNIYSLYAAILSRGIEKQLKHGLYKEYVSKNENLSTIRGKINIPTTIRNQFSRKHKLNCEYDELSVDNLFNRILKSTSLMLLKHPDVDLKFKDSLKKEMLFFSEVSTVDLKYLTWSAIHFRRNSQTYKLLIFICKLVADKLLINEAGERQLSSFEDSQALYRLYELFLLEYYKRELLAKGLEDIQVESKVIDWAISKDESGGLEQLPRMLSDVTLTYKNRILIIDAKFLSANMQSYYDNKSIISENLYQIFSYVKNEQCNKRNAQVSGMLLYAKTQNINQPNAHFNMSGNLICAESLDLNVKFEHISRQLDSYVDKFLLNNPQF